MSHLDTGNYVQTVLNLPASIPKGLYCIETRRFTAGTFKHYRKHTNDVVNIVNDFKCFYLDEQIDVSSYEDVTDEY